MVRRYVVAPRGRWGGYRDITSALRAAAAGRGPARVDIEPGQYAERLVVRGEVELAALGAPGSVVLNPAQGTVLDAAGSVTVRGLQLIGREGDAVDLHAGALVLDEVTVRGHGGVCLHARRDTSATLTNSHFFYGRTVFAGGTGTVERCRFTDAADNALAVIEGGRVTVRAGRFEGSRIHGVRVSDARAELTGCELTGTGRAAVSADTRAELSVTDCVISAVHAEGVLFVGQSRGLVRGCRVSDAEHGVAVTTGSDPVVRDSVFAGCRDTGINVAEEGLGTYQNCEVRDAGTIAVFATGGGAPTVDGCRVVGGNVGIAVVDKARGRFSRIEVTDVTNTALRVYEGARAVFERVRGERCAAGLETLGDAGTTAELTDGRFRDCAMGAVAAGGQSRLMLKDVSAEHGKVGLSVVEEAQLRLYDCEVTAATMGILAAGGSRLFARNVTAGGCDVGLCGTDSAYLDVADSRFADCADSGMTVLGTSTGRLADCRVTGSRGTAVQHNGRVELIALDTPLRVVEQAPEPAASPSPSVVHHHGPVFHAAVHNAQFAWDNTHVSQQQSTQDGAAT
ncbi:right-handed parallel beta-helix repeat-containing protein [Streptomyces sp. CoH27]|uniref:right-handed parallel beta-helix repeat-containing protein n=1 Tax=Streptomyces sp. CoH27 TaxID=2875763 RepID=UPI001CD20780|nr:right-handed parallel beta-helix repeat-containing protein [Streptomyces sp. CoH27]